MSFVLFLFLAHLGIGIAGSLLLVSPRAGVKFFRFNAGLSAIFLLLALAVRPGPLAPSADQHIGLLSLIVSTGLMVVYWFAAGRVLGRFRTALLSATFVSGMTMLVTQALSWSTLQTGPNVALITTASFVSSAALLGGSCTAMILGHWYLVLPSMDVSLLQRVVKFHIGSTLIRLVVVGIVVALAFDNWQSPRGAGFDRYIFSVESVFFWQRLLFGLVGPLGLSYLIWETARIRATQSATGILYVDFFTVIVGEVLAKYLLISQRVPL